MHLNLLQIFNFLLACSLCADLNASKWVTFAQDKLVDYISRQHFNKVSVNYTKEKSTITNSFNNFELACCHKEVGKSQTLYDTKRIFVLNTVRIIVAIAKYATQSIILSTVASQSCTFMTRTTLCRNRL